MPHPLTAPHITDAIRRCIEDCTDCANLCVVTATHCVEKGGHHAEPAHLRLLEDCAAICRTAAHFMLRGSDLHLRICALCAEICDLCAEDCGRFGDDAQMRACAEACRMCAKSCRDMAGPRAAAA